MVDVVGRTGAVDHGDQIVDGSKDIILRNVHRDQLAVALLDGLLPAVLGDGLQHLAQNAEADLLLDAVLGRIKAHELGHIDHAVREHLDLALTAEDHGLVDAVVGDHVRLLAAQRLAVHGEDLAGHGIGDGLGQRLAGQTAPDVHFLIELVAADLGNVIAAGVEEQRVEIGLGAFDCGRLARTKLAVDLEQGFLARMAGILFEGRKDHRILAEQLLDLRVGGNAERTDQAGDGELAVLIDTDVEHVVEVGLILQPCTAVRNDRRGVDVLIGLIHLVAVVHAGAADDLGDDDALCAVDDEGAAVGHQREIAHEDLLLLDLAGLLVVQTHAHLDGLCIRRVALLALLNGVLGRLVHAVIQEAQLQITCVIADRVHILEHLVQALAEEPLVGILLDLQHIGDRENFVMLCKALAERFAAHDILGHRHYVSSQPFFLVLCF